MFSFFSMFDDFIRFSPIRKLLILCLESLSFESPHELLCVSERALNASRSMNQKLSLVLLDKVFEKSKALAMLRCFQLWKRKVDEQRRHEFEAKYAAAQKLLLQQRDLSSLCPRCRPPVQPIPMER